jgi:hypothetical protein
VTDVRRRIVSIVIAGLLCAGILGWSTVPWGDGATSEGTLAAVAVPIARAASPAASPELGGDTRSAGEGPGFVGAPLLAILGVLALGAATALLTLLYVRLTGGPSEPTQATGASPPGGPDPGAR